MADIWIVEDEEKIALLIEMTVRKAGHVPRRFAGAGEMEGALKEGLPDLLLLDLMLSGKDGYQILREWKAREETGEVPVIILSARSAEMDKVRGLELGAEDYVTKPFGVRELQARIQTALRRVKPRAVLLKRGDLEVDPRAKRVTAGGKERELSHLEYSVLLYLLEHADTVVSRAELFREVWGYPDGDDNSRTVDSHIKTLRMKLGDDAAEPRYIKTIRGSGYRIIAGEKT